MSPDLIPRQVVHAALRADLPFFGIACVVLIAAIALLSLARLRSRDRLLLWVGTFSLLYGMRLLLQNGLVHAAMNGREFIPFILFLTYIIPIPFALFARELLGRGWHKTIAVWLWIQVAFAILAPPAALFGHLARWTDSINGVLIIAGTLLILLHVLWRPDNTAAFANTLKWPLIVFSVLVLLTNRGFRLAGFDIEPIGFLILLGGLAATAARRALATERKLVDVEQELATATRIQNSIIPHSAPGLPSLRLATRYQPMTSVAGDFYDFLQVSENCLTILVADVSGHGVPAALVASMLKVCFAAQRAHAGDPAAILAGLNGMLRNSLGGQYVTAACTSIDVQQRRLIYSAAGHPASLLLQRETGQVVELEENGLFIGPFPQATYSNLSVPFEIGDRLLLYTDGITEANGADGEEFGRERLKDLLQQSTDLAPAEFVERLFNKISHPPQQDDLTVVLTQFVG